MTNDARDRILFVRQDRAPIQARWIDAMVAGGRDMLLVWRSRIMTDKEADVSPGFILIQSVE
jgi:hypothetical protein